MILSIPLWDGSGLLQCKRNQPGIVRAARRMPLRPARRRSRLVPIREEADSLFMDHPELLHSAASPIELEIERSALLRFFATCAPGLEPVVAAELQTAAIGALGVRIGASGVYFQGTWETGFKANLWARCAVRILQLIAAADLAGDRGRGADPVYEFVKQAVDWKQLLVTRDGEFRSFWVQSRVWDCSQISNSMSASTRAKDAICDALRDCCGGRRPDPPESLGAAQMPLFLSLYRDEAKLYRDMSGLSLHMRGYRDAMHKASLNEGIAAGALTIAGWNRYVPGFGSLNRNNDQASVLTDPMCGSGTFLIEAALMAMNIAPGLFREDWPFTNWHDFDKKAWKICRREAAAAKTEAPADLQLLGNDFHEGAVSLCARDAEKAGVEHLLKLNCEDCRRYVPYVRPSLVVVNPPWGNRLNDEEPSLIATYMGLGKFLKKQCSEADVYVLSGNSALTRQLQMKADRKWPLTVGGLDCRLLHYYVLPPKMATPVSLHSSSSGER